MDLKVSENCLTATQHSLSYVILRHKRIIWSVQMTNDVDGRRGWREYSSKRQGKDRAVLAELYHIAPEASHFKFISESVENEMNEN